MKSRALILALLLAAGSVLALNVSLTLVQNPDGTYDTAFATGNKDPGSSVLAWDDACLDTALAGLSNGITGTGTTIDVRITCLTGTAKATATITVNHISGDADWSIAAGDDLTHSGVSAGVGVIELDATDSGNTALSDNQYAWQYTAAPSADTTAPPLVRGIEQTGAASGQVTLEFDESCDAFDGEAARGTEFYHFYIDESLDSSVASSACGTVQLSQTIVGASNGTPSTTQSGVDWAMSFAGAGIGGTTDQYIFRGAQFTGDVFVSAKIGTITGGGTFAKNGIAIVEDVTVTDSPACWLHYQKNGAVQMRYRSVAGNVTSQAFTQTITPPVWGALRRDLSANTCTGSYSTDGVTWILGGSAVVAMPATISAGAYITGQELGTNAIGDIDELNIHSLARFSHDLTIASAGTVKITADDNDDNESAKSGGLAAVPGAAGGSGLKWHPGHYEISDNGANLGQRIGYCNALSGESAVKGLQVRYVWKDFEPTEDVYDFSQLTAIVAACKAVDKRVIVELWTRTFGGSSSGPAPPYIQNIDGADTGVFATSGGWGVKIWDARIMDRLILLYEALAAQFDTETHFEMLATGETAQGNGTSAAGYTGSAFIAQYIRLMQAGRAAWPSTQLRIVGNWLSSPGGSLAQVAELLDVAVTEQWSVGGPDVIVGSFTHFQNVWTGTVEGTDYRGTLGIATNVEPGDLSSDTLQNIYDECAIGILACNYMSWMRYWATPTWASGILPFLQSNPTTITTCPTGWTCDTN